MPRVATKPAESHPVRVPRGIIIDGEDGDGAVAAVVHDRGLVRKRAVTVDADVHGIGVKVCVGEQAGGHT